MKVVLNDAPGHHVYHIPDCHYAKRITPYRYTETSSKKARKKGYHGCKYCCSSTGLARIKNKNLQAAIGDRNLDGRYLAEIDAYCLKTEIGFWKFTWDEHEQGYRLYHLNDFNPKLPFQELIQWRFHRQSDVPVTPSMEKILNYVEAHDKAKKIMADDYHKLPQKTKRERMYYRKAEKKERRKAYARLDTLFALISQGADNRLVLQHASQN